MSKSFKVAPDSINLASEVVNQISKYIGVWRSNNNFPKIIDSPSMVDVSQHAIISFSVKTLEKALAGSVPSTNFDAWCYIISYCTIQVRLYFRKIKCPGIGRFVENCLFPKKVFLMWIEVVKTTSTIGDSTSTCPSGLSKCPFVKQRCPFPWATRSFSKNISIQLFSF